MGMNAEAYLAAGADLEFDHRGSQGDDGHRLNIKYLHMNIRLSTKKK